MGSFPGAHAAVRADRFSALLVEGRQAMAELLLLRLEIAAVVHVRLGEDRHLIDDLEVVAVADERVELLGIVREEAHPPEAEILEDLNADAVIARIGSIAEREVRLDGVEPLVLKSVRFEFFEEPDPAPFLRQIDERAHALLLDLTQGEVELIPAFAAERLEQISREAG